MTEPRPKADLVIFLDVDNTLIDNDRLKADLAAAIQQEIGPERAARFWEMYEEVRQEEDFVDFPLTVDRMEEEFHDEALGNRLRQLLWSWPFKKYLYPGALDAIRHLKTLGVVAILSDGDSVFQPLKIERSGLAAAVDGNILIYVHKEEELKDVFSRYPARHYVAVDDKPRIISALERDCPETFTTVLVLQGKYGHTSDLETQPDYIIRHIADLCTFTRSQLTSPAHAGSQRA